MKPDHTALPFALVARDHAGAPEPDNAAWESLYPADWREQVGQLSQQLLARQSTLIICIAGKPGSGKSTLARQIRKQGLPGVPFRQIIVIDDGTLHLKFLGLFPRRIQRRVKAKDYLLPFAPYLQHKRVLVYANATPETRIDRCDLFIRVRCNENLRRERLVQRDHNGNHRYQRTQEQSDAPKVQATYYFDLESAARMPSHGVNRHVPAQPRHY